MALDFPSSPTNGQVYGNYYYNSARGAWNALLPAATPNFFTNATLNTSTLIDATATSSLISTTPLTVIGLSGQTANLQEWKNSSGTVVAAITPSGSITGYGSNLMQSFVTTRIPLTVKGSSGQTANLQEWQNSSGTVLAKVEPSGNISGKGIIAYDYSQSIAGTAATVPSVVRGAASQTADLQQWQSSTGAVLSEINSAGELQVPRIGVGSVMPTTTMLYSTASAVGNIPIVARGAASQTANLQEWQDSSGTAISYINKDGELFAQDLSLTKNTAHIEIGGVSGTANTPYIDFHSGSAAVDFDSRIIASGGSGVQAGGRLDVNASRVNFTGTGTRASQPSFLARNNEYINSARTIVFAEVLHNNGSHYNSSNGRFTAPVAGYYLFHFQTLIYDMGTSSGCWFGLNGTSQYAFAGVYGQFSGTYAGQGASMVAYLNANDYVYMNFTYNTTKLHAGYTVFGGHLLS